MQYSLSKRLGNPTIGGYPIPQPAVDGTIAIANIATNQSFQRTEKVTISGTYTISSGTLSIVMVRFNNQSWRVLDLAPSAGLFSGSVYLPQGVGTLEVRLNDSTVTSSVSNVLVGEVFVIMGQSNAQGQGTNPQSYTGTLGSKMYRASAWSNTADPVGNNGIKGSPYPIVASQLESILNCPIAFVVGDTVGGSGLCSPNADWSEGGVRYENTVSFVNASKINSARAILWYQGEKDADTGRTQSQYQTALTAMVLAFRSDCAALTSTPLISTVIGPVPTATDAETDAIRKAIIYGWDNDSNIYPGPTAHAVFDPADNLHWATDTEMQRLAKMWVRAIVGNFFGGESARGPIVSSAAVGDGTTYTTSQIAITFSGVGSLVNFTDTDGWLITDYNGTRTVTSSTASGNTIILTCDQTLVSTVTVTYGSGDDAKQSIITDGGAIVGMAIEPIYALNAGTGIIVDPLKLDLLGWYEFETLTADSSPLSRTLTNNNSVTQGTGKVGSSSANFVGASLMSLTRASDYTTILSTGFTVCYWFKTSGTVNQGLVNKAAGITANGQWANFIGSTGGVTFRVLGASGAYIGRTTPLGYNDGNWHFVVLTYDGSGTSAGCKIYIDNVQVDNASTQSGTWTTMNSAAASFEIGKAATLYLTGDIDNTAVWNKVLSSTDRSRLWNSGNGLDWSSI